MGALIARGDQPTKPSKEAFAELGPIKRAREKLKEVQDMDAKVASGERKLAQSSSALSASTRARRGRAGSYSLMSDQDTLG